MTAPRTDSDDARPAILGDRPITGVRQTLPPPSESSEGPFSMGSLALAAHRSGSGPVARRYGPRAELSYRQATLADAAERGDSEGERTAAALLGRALAARGSELDLATRLGRRALLLGEDSQLREELAAWFAQTGEPAHAAATLRPIAEQTSGAAAADVRLRMALLLVRAGDVAGALENLELARAEHGGDPAPLELLGLIGGWAPEQVRPERAAEAYLEAYQRREQRRERPAAFENLLRAFELAPDNPLIADRLCALLASRGRLGAADEVKRLHAEASLERKRGVHLQRMHDAVAEGDFVRALAAAFDAGLDTELDPALAVCTLESPPAAGSRQVTFGIDELLLRLGLYELLAARLELSADVVGGAERARLKLGLARLYTGPLASPERAADAWLDAAVADPTSDAAREGLARAAAEMGDSAQLVEAYIRLTERGTRRGVPGAAACTRELLRIADERLADPTLALWAIARLRAAGLDSPELASQEARLLPRARLQDEAYEAARAALEAASGAFRVEPLRRLAALLRGRPDRYEEYLAVLTELVERCPEERSWEQVIERLLVRRWRWDELERQLERRARGALGLDRSRARQALAALRWRRGDGAGALDLLAESLAEPSSAHPSLAALMLCFASGLDDQRARAKALLALSGQSSATLRATLSTLAAEAYLAAGVLDAAAAAADQACSLDPALARPVATRARVALMRPGPQEVEALERAMAVVVARAELCRTLADVHQQSDTPALSLVWTQRWLALRPGDAGAVAALLERAERFGDAARIADALGWTLSQPLPLSRFADGLSRGLARLAALDPPRAAALARRALDSVGPGFEAIRKAVLDVAELSGDRGLTIALLERWVAGSAPQRRPELLLEIARRRRESGDTDGAARALVRALSAGASREHVAELLAQPMQPRGSDGVIFLLQARAMTLADGDPAARARALRDLGAARWDLAADRAGAVEAWVEAARLDPEHGLDDLARDLVAFAGYEEAERRLLALAEAESKPERAARVFATAAVAALESGRSKPALVLAERALELDLSRTDALAVVERAAGPDQVDKLETIYRRMAEAALGCYGERAVYYRAARQLDRRGELASALRYAVQAFEAVPAEGVTFVLMARLAERIGETSAVVRAIDAVSSRAPDAAQRSYWLKRAALFTDSTLDGKRLRLDVLLRAISVQPEVETIGALGQALAELVSFAPEDAEIVELRFERALEDLLPRLSGPEGARVSIAAARAALTAFGWTRLAFLAIGHAVGSDASVDEYQGLLDQARVLANEPEPARALVRRCLELGERRSGNAGRWLLELGAALATEFDDTAARAKLLVLAALTDPEDRELVRRAEQAGLATGDPRLMAQLLDAIPASDRVTGLLEIAAAAENDGDLAAAIAPLEQLLEIEGADARQKARALDTLRRLYVEADRVSELEQLLLRELGRTSDVAARVALLREIAGVVAQQNEPERALALLEEALVAVPDDEAVLADVLAIARQGDDRQRLAEALGRLADATRDPGVKLPYLRELAALLDELGESAGALSRYQQLLDLEPTDLDAIAALERDAEHRGEYERLVELLEKRASLVSGSDEIRRIRLRRAVVLEQRLGRPDAARTELEQLLEVIGDNLSVLRLLADLHERLGADGRAAPLWLRAGAIAKDPSEASDLARRAGAAFLKSGDVAAARQVLEGIPSGQRSEGSLELLVEIARRDGDLSGLSRALEELARVSSAAPDDRARMLVEAARAASASGDAKAASSLAERAARVSPRSAEAQLFAKTLAYKLNGFGDADQARSVVAELRGVGATDLTQAELRAFLIAEALDVAVGADAALRELGNAEAELGAKPLIALGLGERLLLAGEVSRALDYLDVALGGDLAGVRGRGAVALAAAQSARDAGQLDRALGYLELAAADPEVRARAVALQEQLRVAPAPTTAPLPPRGEEADPVVEVEERDAVPEEITGIEQAFTDEMEKAMLGALARGSLEAGRALMERLEGRVDRTHDLVAVVRRVSTMVPGEDWALVRLQAAALADRDFVYARALEPVLALLSPSHDVEPAPPLSEQPDDPERVRAMLFRDTIGPVGEALSLVWEGAEHVFRRDPTTYGVTGLERVPLGAPTPLGHAYSMAARCLGLPRTPLFQRRSAANVTVSVALLSPPSVIVSGEVREDSPELRFHVAAMLAAAMPERALLFGTSESQVKAVLEALALAFGPPQPGRSTLGSATHLAEVLWESIPMRAQRRLRELCDDPRALDHAAALERARSALRRAGLFVCGDLGVALSETCLDEGQPPELLDSPGGLAELCRRSPAVTDLVRLATSPEYAAARWQPARSGGKTGGGSKPGSGTYKLF